MQDVESQAMTSDFATSTEVIKIGKRRKLKKDVNALQAECRDLVAAVHMTAECVCLLSKHT